MSLREDFRVFRQPGFYISAVIVSALIGGFLAFTDWSVARLLQ